MKYQRDDILTYTLKASGKNSFSIPNTLDPYFRLSPTHRCTWSLKLSCENRRYT